MSLSMHFMYVNLKVGSMSTSSCIFFTYIDKEGMMREGVSMLRHFHFIKQKLPGAIFCTYPLGVDIRTWILAWRPSGRISRSRSLVKGQGLKNVHWDIPLTSESLTGLAYRYAPIWNTGRHNQYLQNWYMCIGNHSRRCAISVICYIRLCVNTY